MGILATNKMVYTTITYFFSTKSVRNVYVSRTIMISRTKVEYCPFLAIYATTLDVSLTPSPEASSFQPAMPTTSLYHTSHATQPPPLRHHSTPTPLLPHSTLVTPSLPQHNSMPNTPLCHFTTSPYYVAPLFTAKFPLSLAAVMTHSTPPGGLHSMPSHAASHSIPAPAGPQPIPSASVYSILPPGGLHAVPPHADPHSIPPAVFHSTAPEVLHSIPPAISHSVPPPEVLPPAGPQPVPHASPRFVPLADPHSMPPAGPNPTNIHTQGALSDQERHIESCSMKSAPLLRDLQTQ